ncbi:MAG: LytTR family DNA-binding domain-containing protein [Clostridia bacterium]|nr:LytTR family DNA-binding domain-containing protein [Clostridia bacterium]
MRIEIGDGYPDEVVIRCSAIGEEVLALQKLIREGVKHAPQLCLTKGDAEYYVDPSSILFFETEGNTVMAHTADNAFEAGMKLYELESLLGATFQRISKSAVVNTKAIWSIARGLSGAGAISFRGTHKQVYVSRAYYKQLKEKLEETR